MLDKCYEPGYVGMNSEFLPSNYFHYIKGPLKPRGLHTHSFEEILFTRRVHLPFLSRVLRVLIFLTNVDAGTCGTQVPCNCGDTLVVMWHDPNIGERVSRVLNLAMSAGARVGDSNRRDDSGS